MKKLWARQQRFWHCLWLTFPFEGFMFLSALTAAFSNPGLALLGFWVTAWFAYERIGQGKSGIITWIYGIAAWLALIRPFAEALNGATVEMALR